MSLVGRQRGDGRRNLALTVGAVAAALAIGAPAAQPVVGGATASTVSSSREALPPIERRRAPPKPGKKQPKRDGPKGRWTFYRDGALDPQGTMHSYRAMRRDLFEQAAGMRLSGRQWVRFRKWLRREAPECAAISVPEWVFGSRAAGGAR